MIQVIYQLPWRSRSDGCSVVLEGFKSVRCNRYDICWVKAMQIMAALTDPLSPSVDNQTSFSSDKGYKERTGRRGDGVAEVAQRRGHVDELLDHAVDDGALRGALQRVQLVRQLSAHHAHKHIHMPPVFKRVKPSFDGGESPYTAPKRFMISPSRFPF